MTLVSTAVTRRALSDFSSDFTDFKAAVFPPSLPEGGGEFAVTEPETCFVLSSMSSSTGKSMGMTMWVTSLSASLSLKSATAPDVPHKAPITSPSTSPSASDAADPVAGELTNAVASPGSEGTTERTSAVSGKHAPRCPPRDRNARIPAGVRRRGAGRAAKGIPSTAFTAAKRLTRDTMVASRHARLIGSPAKVVATSASSSLASSSRNKSSVNSARSAFSLALCAAASMWVKHQTL